MAVTKPEGAAIMHSSPRRRADDVRVLIVDDSPIAREVLRSVLETDASIRVVGMAGTGREAIELTEQLRPDLVTMDLVMPGMDGMEATARIMARRPTPILFFSAFFDNDGEYSRSDALAAGALDIVQKPPQLLDSRWQSAAGALVTKVKSLARVPVVTHIHGSRKRDEARPPAIAPAVERATRVVAIGASTGGPKVLDELLPALPANYSPGVVVVQHLADGFMAGWLAALRQRCALTLKVAENGDRIQAGRILFAPSSGHVTVLAGGRIRIDDGWPGGVCPSVDITFASIAETYGARAAGILLTGMGTDGAAGLLAIRTAGGTTMVQDEASCVVFGMPRAAINLDAAQSVLSPARLIRKVVALHDARPPAPDA
jgi:two-component system, chemotaxis family, protein-glutamate methylesterase/glutaminase